MPDKCCVPNCTTNYKASKVGYSSVFRFPRDEALRKKWIDNIPRKDFQPSKWSVVCVKHFPKDMILAEETIKDKDGNVRTLLKSKVTLKPGAVPEIFTGLTSYLKKKKKKRTDPGALQRKIIEFQERKDNGKFEKDIIKNFKDFCEKLPEKKGIFTSWSVHTDLNFVLFYCCDLNDIIPKIVSSVRISKDMTCSIVVNNNLLSRSQSNWALPMNFKIERWGVLEKILTRYYIGNLDGFSDTVEGLVSLINNKFSHLITMVKSDDKYSCGDVPKQLNFLLEQFNLSLSNSSTYSSDMKEWASMINMYSPSAYQAIRDSNFLVLPLSKHLQRLTAETKSSSKVSTNVKIE